MRRKLWKLFFCSPFCPFNLAPIRSQFEIFSFFYCKINNRSNFSLSSWGLVLSFQETISDAKEKLWAKTAGPEQFSGTKLWWLPGCLGRNKTAGDLKEFWQLFCCFLWGISSCFFFFSLDIYNYRDHASSISTWLPLPETKWNKIKLGK